MSPFFVGLRYYSNRVLDGSIINIQEIVEKGRVVALKAMFWLSDGGRGVQSYTRRIRHHEKDNEICNL